jgi:RhtB (resistance to homoserine/threonine) family protein
MNSSIFVLSAFFALLAAISPGPDFALVSKNSLLGSRKVGIYTAIGIVLGLAIHVGYALLGFSVIIKESVLIYSLIKYAGATYLAFLGAQLILASRKKSAVLCGIDNYKEKEGEKSLSPSKALLSGFFCNALNPKASLFILSFFSQIIDQGVSYINQILVSIEILLITLIWFTILSVIFSHQVVRKRFEKSQKYVSLIMGVFLLSFSFNLAFF